MKWLRGLFQRKRKGLPEVPEVPEVPDSPENWNVGDMAECISQEPWRSIFSLDRPHRNGPTAGEIRYVTVVGMQPYGANGVDVQFLGFARWPGSGYAACAFRKITPRADETGIADADFVRKMKMGSVKV